MDTQKIGKFIAQKRKEKNLTQVQFGELLGVTSKTVSRWENGHYMPDLALLIPMSEILEITLNELLNGEDLTIEEAAVKAEDSIANTIDYSNREIKKLRRKYVGVILGTIGVIVIIITLLHGVFFAEVSCEEGDTSQWSAVFPNHSAYDMGLTNRGEPVFVDADKALKKAKSDYSDAIDAIREEYHLLPFSKYTYKWYVTYCMEVTFEEEMIQGQLNGLLNFLDVYENSFQWKNVLLTEKDNDEQKEELTMTMIQISMVFIGLGAVLFIILLCTNGYDCIKYFIYRGRGMATVYSVEEFKIGKSKRIVEKQEDGGEYVPVPTTQDKSVHYIFNLYGKFGRKMQAVIKWNTEDANWKARYPYLRKKNGWNVGEEIEIHYSVKEPWKYAIQDKSMRGLTIVEGIIYLGLCSIGVLILVSGI